MVFFQVLLRLDERLVITTQGRSTVATDEAGSVLADLLIAHTLQHWQTNQCLHTAHERLPRS